MLRDFLNNLIPYAGWVFIGMGVINAIIIMIITRDNHPEDITCD